MPDPLLLLIPALPLMGAVILALGGRGEDRVHLGVAASGTVGLSALLSTWLLVGQETLRFSFGSWIHVGGLTIDLALSADPLSAVMAAMITGVGLLIHIFSIGYMDDPADARSTWRYFALLNLFVAAMLVLVLADNLPLLFLGWEGVGLCSYLLIGFWFQGDGNAAAAKKAFLFNRAGDLGLLLAMAWLLHALGPDALASFASLRFLAMRPDALVGAAVTAIPLLLLFGATGKSAQIPLHAWLPDAMAGPTPVSALIHAATMVTAGIYLVCRLHWLFTPSPVAMAVMAIVGAATALGAAFVALTQTDIKRVLAFSTISQLGFMFLGLGSGAFSGAVFHLLTHAFFKALLFLGAGSLIHALHALPTERRQDLRAMGGLRHQLPFTFATMGVGWLAIIGVPGFSGFFSKEGILSAALGSSLELWGLPLGTLLWATGTLAAWLTALYMSRLMFLAFFGTFRGEPTKINESGSVLLVPLMALATLATVGGVINLPHWLGGGWLDGRLGLPAPHESTFVAEIGPALLVLAGVAVAVTLAWLLFVRSPQRAEALAAFLPCIHSLSLNQGWVDANTQRFLLGPIQFLARRGLDGIVEGRWVPAGIQALARLLTDLGRSYGTLLQNGRIQAYALAVALGTATLLFLYTVA